MKTTIYLLIAIATSSCATTNNRELTTFNSFDGTQIYYKEVGKGEPIILLHGFISSGSSWYETELVKQLVANRYRVIIPDMRGNGRSDKPQHPEAYKNNAEIKDIIALSNHLGLKNYQAIGYSRGSIVLAELLTEDNRITKAVLGGMGLDFTNPDWPRRKAFAAAFAGRAPRTQMTEGAVNYAKSINADLAILGMLQDHQPVTPKEKLKNISIPVLVIAGNSDKDNGEPKALQEALGNAILATVTGDHNTTYRNGMFADAIVEFLNLNKEK